jgi:hypothetical protein
VNTFGNDSIKANIGNVFGDQLLTTLVEIVQTSPSDRILSDIGLNVGDFDFESIRLDFYR